MSKYQFGSIVNRDFRRTLQRLADDFDSQGKTVKSLVADGQLTVQQYAELIRIVNGSIKKGEVSVYDIDKNKGRFDATFFTSDFLKELKDGEINTTELMPRSVTREIIDDNAVSPQKTNYFKRSRNLALEDYRNWSISDQNGTWSIRGKQTGYNGSLKVVEVEPNTQYTVKKHGTGNRFRIGGSENYPEFPEDNLFPLDQVTKTDDTGEFHTLTTNENIRYLYIYVSSSSQKPLLQVERGARATDFVEPYILPMDLMLPEIETHFQSSNNTLIESSVYGYPKRTNATSVVWIGPNEPSEVEPFDEWRKTEGFIHYTDFHEYVDQLSDWKEPWASGGTHNVDNHLIITNPAVTPLRRFVVAWEKVEDGYHENVEVYIKMKLSHIHNQTSTGNIILRGSGNSDTANGYMIGPRTSMDYPSRFRISKYVDGQNTVIGTFNPGIDVQKPFNVVARIEDDAIKVKAWQEDIEPLDWDAEIYDFSILNDGFVGLFHQSSSTTGSPVDIYEFGVGTGGMRAPRRRLY